MSKSKKCSGSKKKILHEKFPFLLLLYWMKEDHTQENHCNCGELAVYVCEQYIDGDWLMKLHKKGKTMEEVGDVFWPKMIAEQQHGVYTTYLTSYLCQPCAQFIVQSSAGTEPAKITMASASLPGKPRSVLIAAHVESPTDHGTVCAASTSLQTIEKLKDYLHHPEKASFLNFQEE